jgi:DNA-binding HxlR family transcriptional regulator
MKQSINAESCPVIHALHIIGGKWKLPLLWYLSHSKDGLRYNELKRKLDGITNIMLTRTLRELEDNKIVIRTQYCEVPPHVAYSLTKQGEELIPALSNMKAWGENILEHSLYETDRNSN